jgi:hypothetical protein
MSDSTFTNFEKLYGTNEFLKAVISIQNEILVDKGLTTVDYLRSRLQTELVCRATKIKDEISNDLQQRKDDICPHWKRLNGWDGGTFLGCDCAGKRPPVA